MKAYRIKDWEKHFENDRSKTRDRLAWVPMPNRHDGEGYARMIAADPTGALFGAWCAVVQVHSQKDKESRLTGCLTRSNGEPHTADSLSLKTKISAETIRQMLGLCSSQDLGWIEVVACSPSDGASHTADSPPTPLQPPAPGKGREGKEGNGREEKKKPSPRPSAGDYSPEFESWWSLYPKKAAKGNAWKQWQALSPDSALQLRMADAVREQTRWRDEAEGTDVFVAPWKDPERWIKGRCWEDEPSPEIRDLIDAANRPSDWQLMERAYRAQQEAAERNAQ